ncbi:hypothetical protein [Streptomyces erythrochromogenes]
MAHPLASRGRTGHSGLVRRTPEDDFCLALGVTIAGIEAEATTP